MEGTLTDCNSGEVSQRSYEFEIWDDEDEAKPAIFRLIGGPTGYESFYMHDFAIKGMREKGWTANAGTKGRWDRLSFSPEEMSKAFSMLEEAE